MKDEILKRLDAIAATLNTTAAHLWDVLVRQARLEGIEDSALLALLLVGAYWLYRWTRSILNTDDDSEFNPIWLLICLLWIVCVALTLMCIYSIPLELFNPEYYALRELLHALGK